MPILNKGAAEFQLSINVIVANFLSSVVLGLRLQSPKIIHYKKTDCGIIKMLHYYTAVFFFIPVLKKFVPITPKIIIEAPII